MSFVKGFIAVIVLIIAIAFAVSYGMHSITVLDSSHDMSGTQYEEEYNGSVQQTIETFSIMSYLPYIVIAIGIVLLLGYLYAQSKKYL